MSIYFELLDVVTGRSQTAMRIAIYSYDNVNNPHCGGGGAYRLLAIHRELSARHSVTAYTGHYAGARAYDDGGVKFRQLGFGAGYLLSRVSFAVLATIHSILVRADLVVVDFSAFAPVLGFVFRRRCVLQFQHFVGREPFRKYSVFGAIPWLAERIALSLCRNVSTSAESVAKVIREKYQPKDVVQATGNGFDASLLGVVPRDDHYLLHLGRLDVRMKGIDTLIDAFERVAPEFPDHSLKLVGRGSERDIEWTRSRLRSSPFAIRMELVTNVSEETKRSLLGAATFICVASRFEGWCIAAVEAAACGKAVLGSRILGLQDAVSEGATALLVPPDDAQAFSDGMRALLNDPTLRQSLEARAKEWARRFTWPEVARLQERIYRTVVDA